MRLTLTIFLSTIIGFNISANGNYKPGYLVFINGDTIGGYLLVQNSLNASKFCVFKKGIDDLPTKYAPNDIRGYRYFEDKYYISKEISVDSNHKKFVFLEFLINGISDIYYYKDSNGDHYFIEKDKIGLIELTEKEQIYDGVKIVPAKYKGKLRWVMADCSVIDPEIQKTDLNHKSLIKLGRSYHEKVCGLESCIIYERKNLSGKYKFGLILGLSMNKYNFGNRLISSIEPCYQIGVGMKIENILYSNKRFHLDIKFLLEKDSKYLLTPYSGYYYNYRVSYNNIEYDFSSHNAYNSIPNLSVNLNIVGLKIPIIINYNFPFKNSSVYMGMGLSDKIIIHQNKQYKDYQFHDQYGKSINTFLIGGIANIGIDRDLNKNQKIGINLNYEYMVPPGAVNSFLRLRENQISLQINYNFK